MMDHISVGKGYRKYHFDNQEKAKEAKAALEQRFPDMRMKTNEYGTLFCHESGSMNFHLLMVSLIHKLGGIEAAEA